VNFDVFFTEFYGRCRRHWCWNWESPGKLPPIKGPVNMQQYTVKRGMMSPFSVTHLGLKTDTTGTKKLVTTLEQS
jgi:hypothetical protein